MACRRERSLLPGQEESQSKGITVRRGQVFFHSLEIVIQDHSPNALPSSSLNCPPKRDRKLAFWIPTIYSILHITDSGNCNNPLMLILLCPLYRQKHSEKLNTEEGKSLDSNPGPQALKPPSASYREGSSISKEEDFSSANGTERASLYCCYQLDPLSPSHLPTLPTSCLSSSASSIQRPLPPLSP